LILKRKSLKKTSGFVKLLKKQSVWSPTVYEVVHCRKWFLSIDLKIKGEKILFSKTKKNFLSPTYPVPGWF